MPITRTPIIDDDGSGRTGTPIDNVWKQEFYDQIDASAGVLTKTAGADTNTAAHALASVVVPPLAYTDALHILVSLFQFNAAGSALYVTVMGDVVLIRLDDIGGGALTANSAVIVEVVVRCINGNPRAFLVKANGASLTAVGQLTRVINATASIAHWLNGGWSLGLEVGAAIAGAQVFWTWSVRRA